MTISENTTKQLKFEEQIMACWHITNDIDSLSVGVSEADPKMSTDDVMNILIGLSTLYDLKFQALFRMFESALPMEFDRKSDTSALNLE